MIMEWKAIMSIISIMIPGMKTVYPRNNSKEEVILMIMLKFMVLYLDQAAINMLQMHGQKNLELKVLNLDLEKLILINSFRTIKRKRNQHLDTIN